MTQLPYTYGDLIANYGPDPHGDLLQEIAAGLRHDRTQRRNQALRDHLDDLHDELDQRRGADAMQMLEHEFERLGIPEHDRAAVAGRALQQRQTTGTVDLESAYQLHRQGQEEQAAEWFDGELADHERRIGRTLTDSERQSIYDQMVNGDAADVPQAHTANDLSLDTQQGRWRYATERVSDLRDAEQREQRADAESSAHELGQPTHDLTAPGDAGIEARAQAVRDLITTTTDQE